MGCAYTSTADTIIPYGVQNTGILLLNREYSPHSKSSTYSVRSLTNDIIPPFNPDRWIQART